MKRCWNFLFVIVVGFGLLAVDADDAYAKRLGGGRSFGGQPSYSQPYRPAPDYGAAPRSAPSAVPSPVQRNQAMRESFRNRGGLMGMLGGLALGGLIGAMLFGGGFEHINFLDILVLGVVAYLGFRLLAARRSAPQWDTGRGTAAGRTDDRFDRSEPPGTRRSPHTAAPAGFDTDIMSTRDETPALPPGFDRIAFINGAKQAYRHLQQAWDIRDLAELRALTTDRAYAELAEQLRDSTDKDSTEVLGLEAQLLGVERADGWLTASVLFTAQLREAPGQRPNTVRELWHFIRSEASQQPTWYLDGLQQVES